jgi:type IV secretory pathway TrbF-like protein
MDKELPPEELEIADAYDDFLKIEDDREALREKAIRRGLYTNIALAVLLAGMVYANIYQLQQIKLVPFIDSVDEHGQVVTRPLVPAKDVPPEDPKRTDFVSNYVRNWVINGRKRSTDKDVTAGGIRAALLDSAGPAHNKLRNEINEEDVWKRIDVKRETVNVLMPKWPAHIPGTNTWQAEWEEVVTTPSGGEKRQMYSGTFQIAQQDNWVRPGNAYGVKVVTASREPIYR